MFVINYQEWKPGCLVISPLRTEPKKVLDCGGGAQLVGAFAGGEGLFFRVSCVSFALAIRLVCLCRGLFAAATSGIARFRYSFARYCAC